MQLLRRCRASVASSSAPRLISSPANLGWGLVDADEVQSIDRAYEDAQAKALYRLAQPIPVPPADDATPHFIVGFNEYRFQNREAYRNALARALGVKHGAAALRLSIAWHGRLADNFMQGLQKAAGVTLHENAFEGGPTDRAESISRLIASINEKKILSLVRLGITKAGDAELVTRHRNVGEVDISVRDVLRPLTTTRLAVILCMKDELEWINMNVIPRARGAHVDCEIVCLDGPPSPALQEANSLLASLVAASKSKGRPIYGFDSLPIRTRNGESSDDPVELRDVIRTPAISIRGVITAIGKSGLVNLLRQRGRLRRIVYHPDRISFESKRVV